jgi:hypothetical protein
MRGLVPPKANNKNTWGNPPARQVNPVEKLCNQGEEPRSLRVTPNFSSSARKTTPRGHLLIECSKLSRRRRRLGARKIVLIAAQKRGSVNIRSAQCRLKIERNKLLSGVKERTLSRRNPKLPSRFRVKALGHSGCLAPGSREQSSGPFPFRRVSIRVVFP